MPALQILITQVEDRLAMLGMVGNLLDSEQFAKIGGELGQYFAVEFGQRRHDLNQLLGRLVTQQEAGDGWSELAALAEDCDDLYGRFVAYIQAQVFRTAGLDQGAGIMADALLHELAAVTDLPWRRHATVGGSDGFEDRTEVIQVRFPQYSVWLLPIVAHEFGHFAESRIRDRDGSTGTALIAKLAALPSVGVQAQSARGLLVQRTDYLAELFADTFATWVLGPAYACTALLLALNPNDEGGWKHPPARARAAAVMRCLSYLNTHTIGRPYADILNRLKEVWPETAEKTAGLDVQGVCDQFMDLLERRLPAQARHQGWTGNPVIRGLRDALVARTPPGAAAAEAALRPMLNAAWYARLTEDPGASPRLTLQAQHLIMLGARRLLGLAEAVIV